MRSAMLMAAAGVAVLAVGCAQQKPIRLEAESGRLHGVTIASTQPTTQPTTQPAVAGPSGGAYVTNFRSGEDQLALDVDVPAGFYEIMIGYRSASGPKGYGIKAGDMEFSGMFEKTGEEFAVARGRMAELPGGKSTITLEEGLGVL